MKKLFFFTILLISSNLFAQENYKWDVVIDSLQKSKDKLYNDTKVFIVKTWNSANNVIQLDDKENSHIMVKGIIQEPISAGGTIIGDAYYSYLVNFYFKDNKAKISIDNVQFSKQTVGMIWDTYLVNLPTKEYPGMTKAGLSKKSYERLYTNLNFKLQSIIDMYIIDIKKESKIDNW